jgi:photosystem II stability/assembly factor-like uncharacterized protein
LLASVVSAFASASQPALAGPGAWTTHGPYGGIVNTVVVDPAAPATVYAASPVGGIFKSTNHGQSWAPATTGLASENIDALLLDPANSQTLYAAGGYGLFTSTNGGASWTTTSKEISISLLALDPATPTTLYAIGNEGYVYRSKTGGKNWYLLSTKLPGGEINAFLVDPVTPTNLYAGAYGGLYKSTNGGKQWKLITAGLANSQETPDVASLWINPKTPAILYAETGLGLETSTDSGETWTVLSGAPEQFLGLDPEQPSTLYALDYNSLLYISTNSGVSWSRLANLTPTFNGYTRTLVVDPTNSQNLYAGTDEGMFVSTTQGSAWKQENDGIANTGVTSLAADPASALTLYAGTEYSGIFKTTNGGKTWALIYPNWIDKPSSIVVNPKTPKTLYIGDEFHNGVLGSTNGGTTWTSLLTTQVFSMALNTATPTTLFAGSGSVPLYESTNAGSTWSQVTNGLLGVSPTALFAIGTNALIVDPNTSVYLSTDSGTSWTASAPSGGGSFNTGVLYTSGSQTSALIRGAYAGTSLGYYLASIASPTSWTAWAAAAGTGAGNCAPVNSIAVVPQTPSTFYAGTNCGVLQGTNNGATVMPLSKGLPAGVAVNAIVVPTTGKTIFAGTYGRGVYAYTVP